jgi:hypothetical protein
MAGKSASTLRTMDRPVWNREQADRTMQDLRDEIELLRQTMLRIAAGLMGTMLIGFPSLIIVILIRGG